MVEEIDQYYDVGWLSTQFNSIQIQCNSNSMQGPRAKDDDDPSVAYTYYGTVWNILSSPEGRPSVVRSADPLFPPFPPSFRPPAARIPPAGPPLALRTRY